MVNNSKKESLDAGSIGRRDFICKSAMFCCVVGFPFNFEGISKGNSSNSRGFDVKPTELATYCGLYCGLCDIYQKRIGQSGKELKKLLDAYKFSEFASQLPGFEDFGIFYKVLNNIITFFGQCEGCQKGGGDPQCQVRLCCRERGYQTCAECPSVPCEKLKAIGILPFTKENLQKIKKIGYEKWCQKQQEMVNKGLRHSDIWGWGGLSV